MNKQTDNVTVICLKNYIEKIANRSDNNGFLGLFVLTDHCENLDHSVSLEGSWSMMCKELSEALTRRLKGG